MDFIQHPTNNGVLGAPKGVSIEDCRALPVTHTELGGSACVASFWLPDAQELALLNAGKPVILFVQGQTHPPLSVCVEALGLAGQSITKVVITVEANDVVTVDVTRHVGFDEFQQAIMEFTPYKLVPKD